MTIDKRGESMPGFSYVAVDKRGKEKRGSLEAETRESIGAAKGRGSDSCFRQGAGGFEQRD